LDDNKLLTLPSGERLNIPENVRMILEVDSLEQATPATVSRCGMVWFSADTVSSEMVLEHLMGELRSENITGEDIPSTQISFLDAIQNLVVSGDSSSPSLVAEALEFALAQPHIMEITRDGLLKSLRSLLVKGIGLAIEYDEGHPDFPMSGQHMENFAKRWLMHSLLWSFSGSASWGIRNELADMLLKTSGMLLPDSDGDASLADYRVRVDNGEFEPWSDSVPRMEIESHKVSQVSTFDSVLSACVLICSSPSGYFN
jgi:dynein heavy chain 1